MRQNANWSFGRVGSMINQNLTASDFNSSVTYTVTPTANSCAGTSHDVNIKLNANYIITNEVIADNITSFAAVDALAIGSKNQDIQILRWSWQTISDHLDKRFILAERRGSTHCV